MPMYIILTFLLFTQEVIKRLALCTVKHCATGHAKIARLFLYKQSNYYEREIRKLQKYI
jgi:hypothetical protein